jgi:hypothetical protein
VEVDDDNLKKGDPPGRPYYITTQFIGRGDRAIQINRHKTDQSSAKRGGAPGLAEELWSLP